MVMGLFRKNQPLPDNRPTAQQVARRLAEMGLIRTEQGRKMIDVRTRLGTQPFIFKGVTPSGNLRLQETVSTTLRSGKTGFPNVRGVLRQNGKRFGVKTGKGTSTGFLNLGEF